MNLRFQLPAVLLMASFGCGALGVAAWADEPQVSPAARAWHSHAMPGEFMGGLGRVLPALALTSEQKTQVQSLMAQVKAEHEASHASSQASHEAFMAADPMDANYPAMLAAEKANAAARVQAMSDTKTQLYAILTPAQKAQIPALLAANKADRRAKRAA